jgi:ERAP1-like C-terminal domain
MLDRRYDSGPQQATYRRFSLRLLAPLAVRIGALSVAHEPANIEILRSHLQEIQARFGDTDVIAAARRRFDAGSGTPAALRTALNIVAATADPQTFDELLRRAQQTQDPLLKLHVYSALAGVNDPTLARRMLDVALSDQVPAGTAPGLIERLAEVHPDLVWNALVSRLDDTQLPLTKDERWTLASDVARQSAQPTRIPELEAYEQKHVPPEARKPFLGAVADIRRNQRIVASVLPEIDLWVTAHTSAASSR